MEPITAYITLFAASFLAATIIPAQSEAILFGLLTTGTYSTAALLTVASIGNVLGACLNWLIGRTLTRYRDHHWFPVSQVQLAKSEDWYQRYGRWSLLLSWVPIIGDPITVAAGILRESFPVFLVLVTIAKVGRYAVIVAIQQGWFA